MRLLFVAFGIAEQLACCAYRTAVEPVFVIIGDNLCRLGQISPSVQCWETWGGVAKSYVLTWLGQRKPRIPSLVGSKMESKIR